MPLEEVKQLVERLKQDYQKEGYLSEDATKALQMHYDKYEKQVQQQQFVSIVFPFYLQVLSGEPQFVQNKQQNTRNSILELLAKQIKSTEYNAQIFQKIMYILEKDNEINAKIGAKILNELIKQSNLSNQQRQGNQNRNYQENNEAQNGQNSIQKHILTLYKFLERKTQFLKDIQKYIDMRKDTIQIYLKKEEDTRQEKQPNQPEKILQNEDSINFLTQIPHIYVYTMAYIETQNQEVHFQIKESIKNSIDNIVQALSKTPFEDIYNKLTRQFNMDLFSVMHKMTQFLYILMRKDKDISQDNVNNQNLLKHAREQVEHIQFEKIIKATLNLLKNCPEDFQYHRIEIVNRLKYLINCMSPNSKLQDVSEIINENVILGKNKLISDYTKNALYNFWIDIIRTLFVDKFYEHNQKGDYAQDNDDTFLLISKVIDSLIKNIFDNSLYLQVHEKSLDLIKKLIETLYLSSKKDHYKITHKKNLLYKILHSISLKFGEIRENFTQIKSFIKQVKQRKQQKSQKNNNDTNMEIEEDNNNKEEEKKEEKDLFTQEKEALHLSQMPKRETEDEKEWNLKRLNYIETDNIDIESHLLTLSAPLSCHLNIYDEEDELIINGMYIRENTYLDHMKEIRNKIVDVLIEITKKILSIFYTFQVYNIDSNYREEQLEQIRQQQHAYFTTFQIVKGSKVYGQLGNEACLILGKILKNGLQVFEFFHDFKLHNDEKDKSKPSSSSNQSSTSQSSQQNTPKINLSTFMSIFATVFYETNFKNIVEPNMELIFKYLLKYARDCSDQCLQNLIIEPFCNLEQNQSENQQKMYPDNIGPMPKWNKNIVEILTHYLLLRLEESMEPFHPFYEYRDDYFCLLQKLIRFPFRCLCKFGDDSFIKPYFRQIVLFLIKKAHTSEYSLEYLQLLRTLFKNLIFNQNSTKQSDSQLFTDFNSICYKPNSIQESNRYFQQEKNNIFCNVNVIENLMAFYDTGIPELKEIVTELVMMLPLKSKFLIQLAKSKIIAKPLINSLLLTDCGFTLRTLKTLEIIIQTLSFDEVNYFLDDVKEDLLNKLYKILIDAKATDLKNNAQIDNGVVGFTFKLLGKLGHIPRMQKIKPDIDMKKSFQEEELNLILNVYQQNKPKSQLSLNFVQAIHYSTDILKKLLDNNFALYVLKGSTLETSFCLVKLVLLKYFDFRESDLTPESLSQSQQNIKSSQFKQTHSKLFKTHFKSQAKVIFSHQFQDQEHIIEKVLCTFMELVSLNFKLNITQTLIQRIKEQSELFLKSVGDVIGYAYADEMLQVLQHNNNLEQNNSNQEQKVDYNSDSQKNIFLKSLVKSLKQKVIIIREDILQQKDLIMQPGDFLWNIIKTIIKTVQSQLNQIKEQNPQYNTDEQFNQFCQYIFSIFLQQVCLSPVILNHRHSLIESLIQFLDLIPDQVFLDSLLKFFQIIFIVIIDLPEVIVLGTKKSVHNLQQKVFEKMQTIKQKIPEETHRKLMEIFVSNLVVYKENTHTLAKDCIERLSQVRDTDIVSLFYQSYQKPEDDIVFGPSYTEKIKQGCKFVDESLYEHNPPQSEEEKQKEKQEREKEKLPIHYSMKQLYSEHPTLYISQILKHIIMPLETRSEHQNEKKLALLSNVYKTLDFLMNCGPCPAFKILVFNEKEKLKDEQEQKSQSPSSQSQSQPQNQNQNQNQDQPQQQQNIHFKEKYYQLEGEFFKRFIKQGLQIIELNEKHFKQSSKVIQQSDVGYQINSRLSFNDEEYNLNIEDIDLNTKAWSTLLSSIMIYLKSVLLLPSVYQVCKKNSKNRDRQHQESCDILRNRFVIIFKLFEMIMRVERTIRNTARKCLKQLLKHETHPKDLLSNDDKLKVILRPVLICLQREFKFFTPAFLLVLKKILKLLTSCFNKALSDKLLQHLESINPFTKSLLQQYPQDTNLLQNNCKCIFGLLSLFEHLSYAYQVVMPQMPQYPKDSLSKIIKNVLVIEENLGRKIGKHASQQLTRKPLIRFINTMASSAVEFFFGEPEIAKLLLDLLKLDSAHILRERLGRDKSLFISKFTRYEEVQRQCQNRPLSTLTQAQQDQLKQNDPILLLRIIKTLSNKNPRGLKQNKELLDKLNKKLLELIQQIETNQYSQSSLDNYSRKNELSCIVKILLNYCRENHDDIDTLFSLVEVAKIRLPRDQSYLRNFFKNEIFKLYSIEEKRQIFFYFLQYMDKKDVKVESKINASFLIIYPLLIKCQQHGELKQVINNKAIANFTEFIKGVNTNNKHQHSRLDIEILQLSSLLMTFMKEEFYEHKKALLSFGWHFLKILDDKILKHFAYIFTCKFIKIFGIPEELVLQIYVALLKGQDDMATHDYEILALSKKALNILIPYLAKKSWRQPQQQQQQQQNNSQISSSNSLQKSSSQIEQQQQNQLQQNQQNQQKQQQQQQQEREPSWIRWTLKIFQEENYIYDNNPMTLLRFWQIFIKNHGVYFEYKKHFMTQMINSMQYIMMSHSTTSSNQQQKKIAWDLSFLYIEWKFKELKEHLQKVKQFAKQKQADENIKQIEVEKTKLTKTQELLAQINIQLDELQTQKQKLEEQKQTMLEQQDQDQDAMEEEQEQKQSSPQKEPEQQQPQEQEQEQQIVVEDNKEQQQQQQQQENKEEENENQQEENKEKEPEGIEIEGEPDQQQQQQSNQNKQEEQQEEQQEQEEKIEEEEPQQPQQQEQEQQEQAKQTPEQEQEIKEEEEQPQPQEQKQVEEQDQKQVEQEPQQQEKEKEKLTLKQVEEKIDQIQKTQEKLQQEIVKQKEELEQQELLLKDLESSLETNEENIEPTKIQIQSAKQFILDHTYKAEESQQQPEILIKFFTKVAIHSCQEKDDREFMHRCLYLLKKTLFIWPHTKIKYDHFKNLQQKFQQIFDQSTQQNNTIDQLKFQYSFLNILNILLEFDNPQNIFQNLALIFDIISPTQSQLNFVQIDNPYLIHLICCIMKTLLKVAYSKKDEEEGNAFLRKVNKMVQDGLDHYVNNYFFSVNHNQMERQQPNRVIPVKIYLCIHYAKLLFELDDRQIEHSLNPIKQVMSVFVQLFKKQKDRGDQLQNYQNKKYIHEETSLSCMFKLLPLTSPSLTPDQKKDLLQQQQDDNILESTQNLYDDENFETQKLKYQNFRDFLIVLLRIVGAKFNSFTHREDSQSILKTYMYILDNLQDYDLKYEVINLLKCLFLSNTGLKLQSNLPSKYAKMQVANINGDKKMEYFYDFNLIQKIFDKKVAGQDSSQQNYIIGSKIAEERILRSYLQFLCQLAQENHYNWQTQEKLRQFLFLISKVSSGKDIKYLFSQISQIYGGNPLYIIFLILGEINKTNQPPSNNTEQQQQQNQQQQRQQQQQQQQNQQRILYEGEEVLLFAFKYLIFYYLEQSKYDLEIKNILSNTPLTLNLELQKNKQKQQQQQQEQQSKEQDQNQEIKIEEQDQNNHVEIKEENLEQQEEEQQKMDLEEEKEGDVQLLEKEKEGKIEEELEEQEEEEKETEKQQRVKSYLRLYEEGILHKDHYIELIFDLLTNEHPNTYSLCSSLLKPLFIQIFSFFKKSLHITQRRTIITAIENYLIQNEVSYFWANTLSQILAEEIQENEGLLIKPEKMFVISKKLIAWDHGQYYLESLIENEYTNSQGAILGLLEIYNSLGENDYCYGLKNLLTDDQKIKNSLLMCQQREWKRCYNYFESIKFQDYQFDLEQTEENILENMLDQSFQSGMIQDIYKNLNKWEDLKQIADDTHNLSLRLETSMSMKDIPSLQKIMEEITKEKQNITSQGYIDNVARYHCQALIHFSESVFKAQHVAPQNIQQNLNLSIYHSFREWLKLPKNLTPSHINILNKIQLIVELEEGFKLRESKEMSSSSSSSSQQQNFQNQQQFQQQEKLENFDSFYQYIGQVSQGLNQWRERMPHKFEDIITWKSVIDQRVFIQSAINSKMKDQLDQYIKLDTSQLQQQQGNMEIEQQQRNGSLQNRDAGKLLKPFMDITWSNLKFERQMLNFNIILDNKYDNTEDYHPEEKYMFAKYKGKICSMDKFSETLLNLKETISDFGKPTLKDDFKDHRSELMRMKAILNLNSNNMQDAFQDLSDSIKQCANHYKTWKTWLDISFNSFIKNNYEPHYGKIPFYCINYAMRYKPYKSRLYFSDILFILQISKPEQKEEYEEVLKQVIEDVPSGTILLWAPQFCSMIMKDKFRPQIMELLQRICTQYVQHMYYNLSCYNSNQVQQVFKKIKQDLNNMYLFGKMEKVWMMLEKQQLGRFERFFNDLSQIFENFYKIQNSQQLKDWLPKIKDKLQQALKIDVLQEIMGEQFMQEMQVCQHDTLELLNFIRKNVYNKLLEIITHKIQARKSSYLEIPSDEYLHIAQNLGEIEIPGQYNWEQRGVSFREVYQREKNNILIAQVKKSIGVTFKNRKLVRQLTLIGNNQKHYIYNMEQIKNYIQPPQYNQQNLKQFSEIMNTNSYLHLYSQLTSQFQDILNIHFQLSRETFIRHLRLQNPQHFNLTCQTYISPTKTTYTTFSNVLDSFLADSNFSGNDKNQDHGYHYPLTLMQEDILDKGWHVQSKTLNQHMKSLVPEDLLKNYMKTHCNNIQEFISIRKEITYNIASSQFMTYLVNHESKLDDYNVDFNDGSLYIKDISLKNIQNQQMSPYCMRLSRNFVNFLGDIGIVGVLANAFVSMAVATTKQSSMFKTYIFLIMKDFMYKDQRDEELSQKMEQIHHKLQKLVYENYQDTNRLNTSNEPYFTRVYSIIDSYIDIGQQNQVPSQLKYWF